MRTRLTGAIALIALLLLGVGCDVDPPNPGLVRESDNVPPAALLVDPRTVDAAWFLDRLGFPLAEQRAAEAAAGDPAAFDAFLTGYYRGRPPVRGLPREYIRKGQRVVEPFGRGELRFGNEVVPYRLPFDWSRAATPSFHAELHSWLFLTDLLDAWAESGDAALPVAVAAFIDDWIEHNPYDAPAHERAWSEGAVAKRTMVLINLLNVARDAPADWTIDVPTTLALLIQHAEFLFWGEHHQQGNHGIRQDIALVTTAIALPEAKDARAWKEAGLDRLHRIQVKPGFSSEGVWLEHSPGYQIYTLKLLDAAIGIAEHNDVAIDVDFLRELGRQSEVYLAHVITPGGAMPPVGDTAEKTPAVPRFSDGPRVRYAMTGGRAGRAPEALDGFFPEAGQAVLRDTWGGDGRDPAMAFYVHVHAAFHFPPFGHRHSDELSFVMHGLGRWWIVDTGKYAYVKDAYREHVVSAAAHNTYTVDGHGLRPREGAEEGLRVVFEPTLVSSDELAAVRGSSTRFPGRPASFTRTVVLLRARQTLLLLDRLRSPTERDWQGYLHLPPDAAISEVGDTRVVAHVTTHPDRRLEITRSDTPGAVRVARGERDPLLGWHSPAKGEIVPSPVVVTDLRGSDLLLATVVRVAAADAPPVTGLVVAADAGSGPRRVRWNEGRVALEVVIAREAPLRVELTVAPD